MRMENDADRHCVVVLGCLECELNTACKGSGRGIYMFYSFLIKVLVLGRVLVGNFA